MVAGGLDPPRVLADRASSSVRRPRPTPPIVDAVAAALAGIRGAKSKAKVSMRAELSRVEITGPEALVRAAEPAEGDLRRGGKITGDLVFTVVEGADAISVDAQLAPTDA